LQGRKTLVYLSRFEVDGNGNVAWRRDRTTWLSLPLWPGFGAVLALAVAGAVAVRGRWREYVIPVTWAITWSASIVLIQVNGRYRLPCAAIVCVLAGIGAAALLSAARRRRRRDLALLLAAATAGLVLSSPDYLGLRHYRIAALVFQEALILEEAGHLEDAEAHYHDGLDLQYGGAELESRLGLFLARTGRTTEALTHMRNAVDRRPELASLHKDLGATLHAAGLAGEALTPLRTAADLSPRDGGIAFDLGLAYSDLGRDAEAIGAFEDAERLGYREPSLYLMRGVAWARSGRFDAAEADLRRAAAHEETRCQASRNLGLLYRGAGQPESALQAWSACPEEPGFVRLICTLPRDVLEAVPGIPLHLCDRP